jgi:hypothetical protein
MQSASAANDLPRQQPDADGVLACLTAHARRRSAARAISPTVVAWLLDHGTRVHDGHGAELVRLDGRSRRAIRREVGRTAYAAVERTLATAYAVVAADGMVVTVGHRTSRIRTR